MRLHEVNLKGMTFFVTSIAIDHMAQAVMPLTTEQVKPSKVCWLHVTSSRS